MKNGIVFNKVFFSAAIFTIIAFGGCKSVKPTGTHEPKFHWENKKMVITADSIRAFKELIKNYHPNLFSIYSENAVDAKIDSITSSLPTDSITATEAYRYLRNACDYLTYNDPHFMVGLKVGFKIENLSRGKKGSKQAKNLLKNEKVLDVGLLLVNDTLIVENARNTKLERGDRIIAVDGIEVDEILEFWYDMRFLDSKNMLGVYGCYFKPQYGVTLERNRGIIQIDIDGDSFIGLSNKKANVETALRDGCGYIRIGEFNDNDKIVKELSSLIDRVKKLEGESVIIDLRSNPGGSMDAFDEMMSLMCNKDSIPYQAGGMLKISDATLDYGFSSDYLGETISLPDSMFYRDVPLKSSMYKGAMKYYVLVSKDTGSSVASFANMVQYNNIGVVVGEPLLRNALRFGEVTKVEFMSFTASVSTMEMDEHTKAINGILYPDIHIPYIASEYMKGGDPVLEKLLKYLKRKGELGGES